MKIHTPDYDREVKKRSAESEAELRGCVGGGIGCVFAFGSLIGLFLVMSRVGFLVAEHVTILLAYGADRRATGLRIVNAKKFVLNDGSALAPEYRALYCVVAFFCVVIVLGPYTLLLQRLGLLRDGARSENRRA